MVERCFRARRCGLASRDLTRAMSRVVNLAVSLAGNRGMMAEVVNAAKSGDVVAGVDGMSSGDVVAGRSIAMLLRRLGFGQSRGGSIRRRLCSRRLRRSMMWRRASMSRIIRRRRIWHRWRQMSR